MFIINCLNVWDHVCINVKEVSFFCVIILYLRHNVGVSFFLLMAEIRNFICESQNLLLLDDLRKEKVTSVSVFHVSPPTFCFLK